MQTTSDKFLCPLCGGSIELTKKEYLTMEADTGELLDAFPTMPLSWEVYCSNDHEILNGLEAHASELEELVLERLEEMKNETEDHTNNGQRGLRAD